MNTIRRYYRLFIEFAHANLIRDMEFRSNFFLQFVIECFWVAIQLFTINIYFLFTDEILGWNRLQVMFLLGLFRLIKGISDFAFFQNLFFLSDTINKGEMDYLLTKPVNSLFVTSIQNMDFPELGEVVISAGICIYALNGIQFQAPWYLWLAFIVSILAGVAVYYCLILVFSTLAFFTTRLTALSMYQDITKQILRYPTDILRTKNGLVMFAVFILALVATYPAKILLSKTPFYGLGIQLASLVVLFIFCFKFWNFALRHYSSASS
jgi:ABC-2 type transport system permease protein